MTVTSKVVKMITGFVIQTNCIYPGKQLGFWFHAKIAYSIKVNGTYTDSRSFIFPDSNFLHCKY